MWYWARGTECSVKFIFLHIARAAMLYILNIILVQSLFPAKALRRIRLPWYREGVFCFPVISSLGGGDHEAISHRHSALVLRCLWRCSNTERSRQAEHLPSRRPIQQRQEDHSSQVRRRT